MKLSMQLTRPLSASQTFSREAHELTSVIIFHDIRRGKTYAIKNTRKSCKHGGFKSA